MHGSSRCIARASDALTDDVRQQPNPPMVCDGRDQNRIASNTEFLTYAELRGQKPPFSPVYGDAMSFVVGSAANAKMTAVAVEVRYLVHSLRPSWSGNVLAP